MTIQTVGDSLLRDIRENPADDTPRLIYADWLEDQGEPERAEFIRVQFELSSWRPYLPLAEILELANSARLYAASAARLIEERAEEHRQREVALRRRERELLEQHWTTWYQPWAAGRISCMNLAHPDLASLDNVTFRRGFVERISLPLAAFTEEVARAIFSQHPVTEVRLTDREPRRGGDEGGQALCGWYLRMPEKVIDCDDLPEKLWSLLTRPATDGQLIGFKWYDSADLAHADLASAAANWGRSLEGLPLLPGKTS